MFNLKDFQKSFLIVFAVSFLMQVIIPISADLIIFANQESNRPVFAGYGVLTDKYVAFDKCADPSKPSIQDAISFFDVNGDITIDGLIYKMWFGAGLPDKTKIDDTWIMASSADYLIFCKSADDVPKGYFTTIQSVADFDVDAIVKDFYKQ